MATSIPPLDKDQTVAQIAVGFTLGFGFLTVWEAIKQTARSRNPRRSAYIYMIWGEITANIAILVLGYLIFTGVVPTNVASLFFILALWVFEIQLLMQVIINRIAIISETQITIRRLQWATAVGISAINVAVFCIFIPAHLQPPVSALYVHINEYWDRISKVLICLVDAGLNYYFLRVVKQRLVDQYGLMKYAPLVKFNARLMVISVLLDVLLIGLMSLPNPEVFILFHPLVYTAKLNIEMTMASLIVKLARGPSDNNNGNDYHPHNNTSTDPRYQHQQQHQQQQHPTKTDRDVALRTFTESRIRASFSAPQQPNQQQQQQQLPRMPPPPEGTIQRTREFQITVHRSDVDDGGSSMLEDGTSSSEEGCSVRKDGGRGVGGGGVADAVDDEVWLTRHAGHPLK